MKKSKWRISWWLSSVGEGRTYGHDDVEVESEEFSEDDAMDLMDDVNGTERAREEAEEKIPNFANAVNSVNNPANWGVRKLSKLS